MKVRLVLAAAAMSWAAVAGAQADYGFADWCRNRLRVLERYQQTALRQVQAQDAEGAAATLLSGLSAAADRMQPAYGGSLTLKAIQRGRDNAGAILAATANRRLWAKSIVNYLFAEYDFIRHVATDLDIPYYQPAPCHYCQGQSLELERQFVRFTMDQMRLAVNKLTIVDRGMVYPLGDARTFLKALELTSQQTADDLSSSLFATRYACLIDDLWYLSQQLTGFLNYGTGFRGEPDAVQYTYAEASRLAGQGRCGEAEGRFEPARPEPLLNYAVTLSEGQVYTLRADGSRPLSKLVFSAEGWGSEADVDVLVNGDLKGNIYVPRRDPAYYVNVGGEYATSIVVVVRRGSVRIHSVHAIYR